MKFSVLAGLGIYLGFAAVSFSQQPERQTWWSTDQMPLGPGLLEGAGKQITIQSEEIRRKNRDGKPTPFIEAQPETAVRNAEFMVKSATFQLEKTRFAEVDVLTTLGSWFLAEDSAFENCTFAKARGAWTKKWSTNWDLKNCVVFGSSFLGLKTTDYGIHLENCSFFHVDFPEATYRDDPAVESQLPRRLVKNCRFVKCRVPVSFLIATEGCVFENCTFFGPYEKFQPKGKLEVVANIVGSSEGFPKAVGPISFAKAEGSTEGVGSTVRHLYRDGRLMIRGFPDPKAPVATRIGTIVRDLPDNPGKPKELKLREMKIVRGSKRAPKVQFVNDQAEVRGLFVRFLGWRGLAGGATGMHAVVLADDPRKPSGVAYNQNVGPMMQTALGEVIKFMEVRHDGWPGGQRVEISFDDKYGSSEGPSGAVATAMLLESLLTGQSYDPAFAVSGDLNADGSVQPIGGVAAKLRGALKRKSKLVALPTRNEPEVIDLAIADGIQLFTAMQIFSAAKFDEVHAIARSDRDPKLAAAMENFAKVITPLKRPKPDQLGKNATAMAALDELVEIAPNHLSARILRDYAQGKLPKHMSLRGSMEQIQSAGYAVWAVADEDLEELKSLDARDAAENLAALNRIKNTVHPKLKPFHSALLQLAAPLKQHLNEEKVPNDLDKFWEDAMKRSKKVGDAYRRISSDPEFVEDTLR